MKILFTLTAIILGLFAATAPISWANESKGNEIYHWQMDDFPNVSESFNNDISELTARTPDKDTPESLYLWQTGEYPNISKAYQDEIRDNLSAAEDNPSLLANDETLRWQLNQFPHVNQAYQDEFSASPARNQHLKEILSTHE